MHELFYRSLYRIRRVEEEIARIYPTDKIKSPIHLSIGQEAISVGVCAALRPDDVVFGTYRGHALYLAKGGDLNQMIAELYGKVTGCARGKGGSMHLIDTPAGVMGTSAVVATTIPEAVGYAYALQYQGKDSVVVSFFGDGAVEEGVFHESINFAALKQLPIIFVCENNSYAIHTHQRSRQSVGDICDRVRPYGIPTERIGDNDLFTLYEKTSGAVSALRRGESGPCFFECMTYRWKEHVGPNDDFHLGYRTKAEAEPWIQNDPIKKLALHLDPSRRQQIELEVEAEIQAAFDFAESSPFPGAEELWKDVFDRAEGRGQQEGSQESEDSAQSSVLSPQSSDLIQNSTFKIQNASPSRTLSYIEAIREATDLAMAEDESVFLFGLDVDDPKAILGTTQGLLNRYGSQRVFGTPLSEDAMTGVAIGSALAGLRPIHVHIRMDFLMLAMNQLVNMAAKSRYTFGGQVSVPMVVRSMIGKSWGQGAQHSQGLHSFFMHVPGLKVVAPTTPYDAKGCLLAAIQDNNPVMVVEHRILCYQKGPVPEGSYLTPAGKARITVVGEDLTLVGISYMQVECLRAQKYLEEKGIRAQADRPDLVKSIGY
ncbi:hypothetical protein K9N68_31460 [Kovacikia minuta CCNUW1]|uniref:alpha-ketoacid dehydrogenase subunit alpha/beta n=1 Tax=Kovacikia minuta TaxID=2931930 RepID=UPI001CCB2FAE|nr:alpha-ketoacid dehydrogenase subunit alpha/beta [Kovacikia minuta]UBF26004.1 hypothetical protein K9N68_31460 [Kovacikia minuta CCNUW1]